MIVEPLLTRALLNLSPSSEYTVRDTSDPDSLVWQDEKSQPSKQDILAEMARLEAIPDLEPVTALQARRALRAAGLHDAVKAAVDASPDPDAQDSWRYALLWRRDAAWIITFAEQLKITNQQLDALFRQAAQL